MKVNRIISIALSVILMVALLCSSVSANELPMPRATTDIFYTPQMTAGIEWSGYANNRIHDLACSKDTEHGVLDSFFSEATPDVLNTFIDSFHFLNSFNIGKQKQLIRCLNFKAVSIRMWTVVQREMRAISLDLFIAETGSLSI